MAAQYVALCVEGHVENVTTRVEWDEGFHLVEHHTETDIPLIVPVLVARHDMGGDAFRVLGSKKYRASCTATSVALLAVATVDCAAVKRIEFVKSLLVQLAIERTIRLTTTRKMSARINDAPSSLRQRRGT